MCTYVEHIAHATKSFSVNRRPQDRGVTLSGAFAILLQLNAVDSWYCTFGSFVCFT